MSLPSLNLDDHSESLALSPHSPEASLTCLTLEALQTHQFTAPPLQSSISSSSTDSSKNPFLLPIPTQTANSSQASFAYSDPSNADLDYPMDHLPPEIATADISIAPDGSFVETSNGRAARELKRRYDQMHGVNVDVRSPYAITGFVNQHGKQMYRVGNRDMIPPAHSATVEDARLSIPGSRDSFAASTSSRRSRLSAQALIQPFAKTALPSHAAPTDALPRNKLRKTRSIPDSFNGSSSTVNLVGAPAAATGRGHSQSVTGADMHRHIMTAAQSPPPPQQDMFGRLIGLKVGVGDSQSPVSARLGRFSQWHLSPEAGRSRSSSRHSQSDGAEHHAVVISEPFGRNIDFDVPVRRPAPATEYLPMPHGLREMQSFESGRTARAGDHALKWTESSLAAASNVDVEDQSAEATHDASSIPVINEPGVDSDAESEGPESSKFALLPETSMHTNIRTEVFDVLQKYRAVPLLDQIDDDLVIKISYRRDEDKTGTALPRDDPRFVLWATRKPGQDGFSTPRTDVSSGVNSSSHTSRRKSGRASKHASTPADPSASPEGQDAGPQRILVAATIERWIAQLTSERNADELSNFFLTYRSHINSIELCHLLITRFHWSLEKSSPSADDMVRRIVRMRTFVAIKHWLVAFFEADFLGNRDLRMLFANWLNALIRDPILRNHSDGLTTVRMLCKTAKDQRDNYTGKGATKHAKRVTGRSPYNSDTVRSNGSHVLGEHFAAATYQSDVDLDFLPDEAIDDNSPNFPKRSANAHLSALHNGAGLSVMPKPTQVPPSATAVLQPPLPLILQQREVSFLPSAASFPAHHQSSLSRAFVKTIGRLGHWKRVLNSRNTMHNSAALGTSEGMSAFDLELSAGGDLLAVRGGVEQYLKIISPNTTSPPASISTESPRPSYTTVVSEARSSTVVGADAPADALQVPPMHKTDVPSDVASVQSNTSMHDSATDIPSEDELPSPSQSPAKAIKKPRARSSSGSSSDSSFGAPIRTEPEAAPATALPEENTYAFDIVSIDDLDLSDTSSDYHVNVPAPPGLTKPTRKLPMKRDYEFVPRDSVSSMGILSHRSVLSDTSVVSVGEPELGGGGIFQQWQLNAIVDSLSDDEDSGDIEATLRRLEGQINPEKQQEKVSKVDGWVKTIQQRIAAGDYTNETPRFLEDEEGAEDGEPDLDDDFQVGSHVTANDEAIRQSRSEATSKHSSRESLLHRQTPENARSPNASTPVSPRQSPQQKPLPEDVVPLEILQSRVPSRPSTSQGSQVSGGFMKHIPPKPYESWLLNYRTQTLVEHLTKVDVELFTMVKWTELVDGDWMNCEGLDIVDWVDYLNDRARWKVESRFPLKRTALAAVRARFNLVANFVISEIVRTQPPDRGHLLRKLVRIAWKAYLTCSYSTLVAIMTGLQSDWVNKAAKNAWKSLSTWESRVFKDLKVWVSPTNDFQYIRQAVTALVAEKAGSKAGPHASSDVSPSGTDVHLPKGKLGADGKPPVQSCVPFMGIYLSQLYRLHSLPDLIDPTAPYEAVCIDVETGIADGVAHPEVFSHLAPLPSSMQLEPLINVQKHRLIAQVIRTMAAGQELANLVNYTVERKLFQRCLKLRCLSKEDLQRALAART